MIITLQLGKIFQLIIITFTFIIQLFRIITEKDKVPKFEDLPVQAGSKKNSSPQQMLPKPIITTLKNNPTMNLMEFTFKPYTKVIFFLFLIQVWNLNLQGLKMLTLCIFDL